MPSLLRVNEAKAALLQAEGNRRHIAQMREELTLVLNVLVTHRQQRLQQVIVLGWLPGFNWVIAVHIHRSFLLWALRCTNSGVR
jgi:hypothetical protein